MCACTDVFAKPSIAQPHGAQRLTFAVPGKALRMIPQIQARRYEFDGKPANSRMRRLYLACRKIVYHIHYTTVFRKKQRIYKIIRAFSIIFRHRSCRIGRIAGCFAELRAIRSVRDIFLRLFCLKPGCNDAPMNP